MDLSLVALMALVVAGLDAIGMLVLLLRQNRTNQRLADIEEARRTEEVAGRDIADVRVLARRTGAGDFEFIVKNEGPAEALEVDPRDVRSAESGQVPSIWFEGVPIPSLLAGEEARFKGLSGGGFASVLTVELSWTDPRGHQKRTRQISIS
jgi:hypothetical protein